MGYAVNGWQLSGILQWQSGANLTGLGNSGQNFGATYNSYKIPGTTYNVSNASLLGTTDIQLNPLVTCNPTSGLAANQYINPSCFAAPTAIGQNGPTVLPAIYGPGVLQRRSGTLQELPAWRRREEAAASLQRL